MVLDILEKNFLDNSGKEALIWQDRSFSYAWLLDRIRYCEAFLAEHAIGGGDIVLLSADFSPYSVALFLALLKKKSIVALASDSAKELADSYAAIAGAGRKICCDGEGLAAEDTSYSTDHPLISRLRDEGHAGIVIFTSGSTGAPKAALHDAERLLGKFLRRRHSVRSLAFLRFDHIGGLDTLFYSLFNIGTIIVPQDKSPEGACEAAARFSAEVMPVSPSFLSLLLLSRAYERHDLSGLKYITYGAEYMPEALLKKCAEIFPHLILLQKYGTTETGTLRSRSESNLSPWVKIGGEEFRTRVRDGKLEVKSEGLMLGYLNAPSPFTEDGWYRTEDLVDVRGDFFRIRGRESDFINIGGNKVYANEVENTLLEIGGIYAATVYAEENALLGKNLVAKVFSDTIEDEKLFRKKIRLYCAEKLEAYKIPSKIIFVTTLGISERLKKIRSH